MQINLNGKRAIVTGSTAGMAFAIARGLADAGAAVVINGAANNRPKPPEAPDTGPAAGEDRGHRRGSRHAAGVEAFIKRAGDADILVNNLGIFEPKPFRRDHGCDWRRFFEVNVMSGVRLSRTTCPRWSSATGAAVFISSESGLNIPSR